MNSYFMTEYRLSLDNIIENLALVTTNEWQFRQNGVTSSPARRCQKFRIWTPNAREKRKLLLAPTPATSDYQLIIVAAFLS